MYALGGVVQTHHDYKNGVGEVDRGRTQCTANKTINEIMIILRGIFKDAKADNIRSDSPIDAIDNLSLGDREDPDPFTQSEIEKY